MLRILQQHGIAATVMNFRSCAREPENLRRAIPNRAARLYHSGETSDFDFVLRTLAARAPHERRGAIGVSIGANVLLKWLGENGDQTLLGSAVAISTPFDLDAGARHLERGMGRLYAASFLTSLKKKCTASPGATISRARGSTSRGRMRAKTFYEYDDAATAPLHGFDGAADYYERSSSIRFIGRIATPTLCISAADDPFLPRSVLDRVREEMSHAVELVTPRREGIRGSSPGHRGIAGIGPRSGRSSGCETR